MVMGNPEWRFLSAVCAWMTPLIRWSVVDRRNDPFSTRCSDLTPQSGQVKNQVLQGFVPTHGATIQNSLL